MVAGQILARSSFAYSGGIRSLGSLYQRERSPKIVVKSYPFGTPVRCKRNMFRHMTFRPVLAVLHATPVPLCSILFLWVRNSSCAGKAFAPYVLYFTIMRLCYRSTEHGARGRGSIFGALPYAGPLIFRVVGYTSMGNHNGQLP